MLQIDKPDFIVVNFKVLTGAIFLVKYLVKLNGNFVKLKIQL